MGDVVDELVYEIDDDLILESREIMFKEATSRYIAILENSSYDPTQGIPVLTMIKRRQGDRMKFNNCKDLVDLYVYAAGLTDIFPRDTLSTMNSKFIDIVPKKPTEDDIQNMISAVKAQDTNGSLSDMAILANRVRNQDTTIGLLKDELAKTNNIVVSKIERLENLLTVLLSKHGIRLDKGCVMEGLHVHNTVNTIDSHNSDRTEAEAEHNTPGGNTTQDRSRVQQRKVVPPPGFMKHHNDPIESSSVVATEAHQQLGDTSTDQGDTGAAASNANLGEAENNREVSLLSDVVSSEGTWTDVKRRPTRRQYRDEPDHYGDTSTSSGSRRQPRGQQLRRAQREETTTVYVRNIEISESDTDESISNMIR